MIISRSEWGSFRDDGEIDMKVLRKRALDAVKWWNNGKPRKEMEGSFGYAFSIIHNGKLVDSDYEYKGNVITRRLSKHEDGYYGGFATLNYGDNYNDGRGQGGSGCIILDDIRSVKIVGDCLVISGLNQLKPVEYRYRIQERPDEKPFVRPVPKKKEPDVPKPIPKPEVKPKKEKPKVIPKPSVKPKAEKPAKPKAERPAEKPRRPKVSRETKVTQAFEVRVDGVVKGSFSSQPRAESFVRQLRKEGMKARIYVVYL